jgi:hypothetical protein
MNLNPLKRCKSFTATSKLSSSVGSTAVGDYNTEMIIWNHKQTHCFLLIASAMVIWWMALALRLAMRRADF